MKKKYLLFSIAIVLALPVCSQPERLIYHDIKTDASGKIIPWYNADPGTAYDHIIQLVWNFWDTMRVDYNGLPYYMNHQVWRPVSDDPRGLGGDQFPMALSSWILLYAYTGNERVKENMRFIADYYLTHSLSPATAAWPGVPYPYNTFIYSGVYDGDMVIGKGYTQPDKAGSLGIELVNLYKLFNREFYPNKSNVEYLKAAIKIARTLAAHTATGDYDHSPMPFKVDAISGKTGALESNKKDGSKIGLSSYTSNWSGTLELFLELQQLDAANTLIYKQAFDKLLSWMKKYPLQNNRWGPFFEDIPGWSDTQINAITFARFIMNHTQFFPDWKKDVQNIFGWVYTTLGNDTWKKYGVTAINEQTAYRVPGNSHTSRQAATELQYMKMTGDYSNLDGAIRKLNWCTYMVDVDGKNRYPQDEIWLTDGFGDYIRHFLRAMAAAPQLAPANESHILSSTSIIQSARYDKNPAKIFYTTYDTAGQEVIRMFKKPSGVLFNDASAKEIFYPGTEGYTWKQLDAGGGVLIISRKSTYKVAVLE